MLTEHHSYSVEVKYPLPSRKARTHEHILVRGCTSGDHIDVWLAGTHGTIQRSDLTTVIQALDAVRKELVEAEIDLVQQREIVASERKRREEATKTASSKDDL